MRIFEKIFPVSTAKKFEINGDNSVNSQSAIIYYEEAIHYLKMRSKYYEINRIYEKIGKSLLNEARKKENPYIERIRNYQKAYEIFKNAGSALKEETAIEHCILSCTETTLTYYKKDIYSNKSLSYWQDFLYKLAVKAKTSDDLKIVARLLLKEFLQLDSEVAKPAIINFIETFNLPDKNKAEMYLIAADYYLLPSLYRSDMYKLAAEYYRKSGLLSDWVSALEGQYMFYLEDRNFNYLLDDKDVYEITELLGENALKEFFFNIIPYFFSDAGRLLVQECLNEKEYWTIFCQALIKYIKFNGTGDLFKDDAAVDAREALKKKIDIDPDTGLKLGNLLGFSTT